MKIQANFGNITGKIKPLNGVGQPPMSLWQVKDEHFHYLEEANIPYSRLHDTGGRYGAGVYVDIPNIFRNFDADENLEASYDFRSTDKLLCGLSAHGVEPIYRLGITIENDAELCNYRVFPPKSFEKWARICEHIIRHYNYGWANGYTLGITHWEIWNEPEVRQMWAGTYEQYFELYTVTSKHLKACFGDEIKVGGYASCGFHDILHDKVDYPDWHDLRSFILRFFHAFMEYIKKENAPLDFFSWHSYRDVASTAKAEKYCHEQLVKYGYGDVEEILDEWNPCIDEKRFTNIASARILSMMLCMQKTDMSIMNYYDASMGLMEYSGLFNGETHKPYPSYFAMMSFGNLYRLGNEIETASDDENVYVGGATGKNKNLLLIANNTEEEKTAELDISGTPTDDTEILMIDSTYTYAPTGKKIRDGKLVLPPMSCVEIRFYK